MHPRFLTRLLALFLFLAAAIPARPQIPSPPSSPSPRNLNQLSSQAQQEGKKAIKQAQEDAKQASDNNDELYTLGRKPSSTPSRLAIDPHNIQAAPFGDRLDLTNPWLFHSGSNPAFASPTYDDKDWQVLDTSKPLYTNMLFNLNEVWYRVHVQLAPGSKDLALTIANFGGSYRASANGQEIGGYGRMSGRGDFLVSRSATLAIPNAAINPAPGQFPVELVLVIHAFVGTVDRVSFTMQDGISPKSSVFLAPATLLLRDQQTFFSNLGENSSMLTLWAVLLVLAIALTFLIPRVIAYPLLAVYAGGHLFSRLLIHYADLHYLSRTQWISWPISLLLLCSELAALEFCRNIAGTPRRRWFTAFEVLYVLSYALAIPAALGTISYLIYAAVSAGSGYLVLTVIFFLIATGVRRGKQDANVLAVFAGLYLFYLAIWKALYYIVFSYAFLTNLADAFVDRLRPGSMGEFAIVAGFLTVIVVRTLRLVRERASIANEIEAARTMQQLLLAGSTQPTPGFQVETVYLPAGEVGGDFFLVSPCHDEDEHQPSLTVIVGDVSGKGLRAAMRVSMILGVLRREPSREPATMLRELNTALLDHGDTGFTTACCIRLAPDGRFTVANAGHISPYVQGHELQTAPALPLGMAPDQTYEIYEGRLHAGQKLVLLSDGVPEARTHRGELYGFERLAPLTLKPASEIARTAQGFGQADDITVLTISCISHTTSQPPPPPPAPPPMPSAPNPWPGRM